MDLRTLIADVAPPDWDGFVAAQPGATLYQRVAWVQLVQEVFGQRAWFIQARGGDGQLRGALPLVRQRAPLLGSYLTSMPYFNYGGALAVDATARTAVMDAARDLARQQRCRYLELRDITPATPDWITRTDKVSMVLDLPADAAQLDAALGAKLRSQARRAEREGATTQVGGLDLLDAFYDVFCRNMHALGTPVYPRRFFAELLQRFAHCTALVVIQAGGQPCAAGLLVFDGATAEIPWAACREDAKPLGFNMMLYREALRLCITRGCARFDFGRTTPGSGTWRFKAQWGAQPVQLYWHRWEQQPATSTHAAAPGPGRLRHRVSEAWSLLPLSLANRLGPLISPGLPW